MKARIAPDQVSLFAVDRADQLKSGITHRNPTKTEAKAAVNMRPRSGTRRMTVLKFIVTAGFTGATRQEIADGTGLPIQSVCGRVHELIEGELVRRTERERIASTGSAQEVLMATPRGRGQAAVAS